MNRTQVTRAPATMPCALADNPGSILDTKRGESEPGVSGLRPST